MINPATRQAARILSAHPGLPTQELLDAIPAAGDPETLDQLQRDGRRYGYGRDDDGLWWLDRDRPGLIQSRPAAAG